MAQLSDKVWRVTRKVLDSDEWIKLTLQSQDSMPICRYFDPRTVLVCGHTETLVTRVERGSQIRQFDFKGKLQSVKATYGKHSWCGNWLECGPLRLQVEPLEIVWVLGQDEKNFGHVFPIYSVDLYKGETFYLEV